MTRPEDVIAQALAGRYILCTAESCTGGMISSALTSVPGSSAVFDRGFVTYSNDAKIEMLGVTPATLAKYGAVSEPVAQEMANGALAHARADFAISVTGVAGPGGSETKPEGMVCFGIAWPQGWTTQTQFFGAIGRDQVRARTVEHALMLLEQQMKHKPHK